MFPAEIYSAKIILTIIFTAEVLLAKIFTAEMFPANIMRFCHPPDASTSPKYKLLCFKPEKNLFCQI
jgi:hypothetical protein